MSERWCEGLCERLLPEEAFRPGRGDCRACERSMSRARNRLRYQRDAAYRESVKMASRIAYLLEPEQKRAAVRARRQRINQAGAAA
jgi:hypothetical protein